MKEYGIDSHPLQSKYRQACVNWYRKRHVALMDGLIFDMEQNPKPPRDWDERLEQTKKEMLKNSEVVAENLKKFGGAVKENGLAFGAVASEKAFVAKEVVSEKAAALKAKLSEKQYGQKLMSMFGKKKETNLDDKQEEKEEEEK